LRTGEIEIVHSFRCEKNLEYHGFWTTRKCVDEKPAEWYLKETTTREYNFQTGWFEDRTKKEWVFEERTETTYRPYLKAPDQPCDLEMNRKSGGFRSGGKCYFYHDPTERTRWYRPDRRTRRDYYYKSERRYTNDMLSEAVKDYNSNGETDIEPRELRNPSGPWLGGYWD